MSESEERPAPGRLELIQGFVNTSDRLAGTDVLTTAAGLGQWLAARGLIVSKATIAAGDLALAIRIREALRSLLVANAGGGGPTDQTIAALNEAAASAAPALTFDAEGRLEIAVRATGLGGAIGGLLAIAHAEMASGRWIRLKACREQECQWAFYDTSRNRSSRWCRMELCGNRTKNRAFYARHRGVDL
jgi:predicted RNA-binding Zn ribbon-like protein